MTWERLERLPLQAERTAVFLMHSHYQKGLTPTEKEISHASLRAKYELNRIPEIRETILINWQKNVPVGSDLTKSKENEVILAHMVAERLASIEGRLYLEAKQQGLPTPSNLLDLAQRELKQHRTQAKILAPELFQKYNLSENAGIACAKDVLRCKEIHGEFPTGRQIVTMAQISHELEKKSYAHHSKELNQHEVDFLRRREGDLLLRNLSSQDADLKLLSTVDISPFIREMDEYRYTHSNAFSKSSSTLLESIVTHAPHHEAIHHKENDYCPSM